jgi:serine-type D-Ala-D-Ala endopeptidase (penicillin-binding protein 7)
MVSQARRAVLVALVVVSALGVNARESSAANAVAKTRTRHGVSATRKPTRHVARARRARRAPPGGVYARCAYVMDPVTGTVLYQKNADQSAPIASITKLMTAMVFLEQKPNLLRDVEVTREELYQGGHTQLRDHEVVPLGDLFHMSLMCSDNVATRVLARESGLSHGDFIARMNSKARDLGLKDTHFEDPTGLNENNVSTASDVAKMLQVAAGNPLIHSITTTSSYEFSTERRSHQISNTNRLLKSRYQILGGKTGYISESGYCFATWLRADGRDLIAVVLGAPTNATRFADVVRLVQKTVASGFTPAKS